MELEEALDLLDNMFNPLGIPWRRRKNELLYTLASDVKEGVIVELGTDEGMGAIALALGSRGAKVYTIDPYTVCWSSALSTGWGPGKEALFYENVRHVGIGEKIVQVRTSSQDAAIDWDVPVGLLFWDTTVDGANIARDLALWDRHILPGGHFMARDKDNGVFGSLDVLKRFEKTYTLAIQEKFTIVLRKNDVMA